MIQQDVDICQAADGSDAVTYGRYSSDHQRPSSIDDQASECRRFAEQRTLPARADPEGRGRLRQGRDGA